MKRYAAERRGPKEWGVKDRTTTEWVRINGKFDLGRHAAHQAASRLNLQDDSQ